MSRKTLSTKSLGAHTSSKLTKGASPYLLPPWRERAKLPTETPFRVLLLCGPQTSLAEKERERKDALMSPWQLGSAGVPWWRRGHSFLTCGNPRLALAGGRARKKRRQEALRGGIWFPQTGPVSQWVAAFRQASPQRLFFTEKLEAEKEAAQSLARPGLGTRSARLFRACRATPNRLFLARPSSSRLDRGGHDRSLGAAILQPSPNLSEVQWQEVKDTAHYFSRSGTSAGFRAGSEETAGKPFSVAREVFLAERQGPPKEPGSSVPLPRAQRRLRVS